MRYLIIGGAPKAATTSLFSHVTDHPQICVAHRKETYFFARQFDTAKVCQCDETLSSFESYFIHCNGAENLRVEATPYTIYSKDSAEKIAELLLDVTVLFLLCDPVERFISDYRFAEQGEHPATQGTFEEYLEWQRWMKGEIRNAIEMGCYIKYLRPFYDTLGENRIQIVFFEEFVANPRAILEKVCELSSIDPNFYTDYQFTSRNKTINVRSTLLNRNIMRGELTLAKIKASLMHYPAVQKAFEKFVSFGRSTYFLLNDQVRVEKQPIDSNLKDYLMDYYNPYNQELSQFLGRALPW